MRAVVTGGAGFIGSNLVDRLVERGDEVTVVDGTADLAELLSERSETQHVGAVWIVGHDQTGVVTLVPRAGPDGWPQIPCHRNDSTLTCG